MTVLDVLIWIVTVGAFVVGALGVIAPVPLSRLFGAPVGPGNAALFVRALGLRDVVLAIVLAFALLRGYATVVSIALAMGALYAIGDFGLVITAPDRRFRAEHLCHVFGFVVCAVLAYLSLRR